jgi:hypothetical protein
LRVLERGLEHSLVQSAQVTDEVIGDPAHEQLDGIRVLEGFTVGVGAENKLRWSFRYFGERRRDLKFAQWNTEIRACPS